MKEVFKRYWRYLAFPAVFWLVAHTCLLTLVFSPELKNQVIEAVHVLGPLVESNDSAILLLVGCVSLILTHLQLVVILLAMFIDFASDMIIERINKIKK